MPHRHPANTPQAHAPSSYLYPNDNPMNPSQLQPRSSSLPFLMGSSQSKPPPAPSPSNLSHRSSSKAFTAAVAGGIKLKRAFAARRKKSEDVDVSSLLPPTHSSVQASDSSPKSTLRQPSSPSSFLTTKGPTPESVSQVSNRNKVAALSSPSSPNKPSLSPQSNGGNPTMNRISVIPLSPGISSAVNYMTLYDHTSPTSPTPPVSSTSHVPTLHHSPEKEKDRETDREKEREIVLEKEKEKEKEQQTKESRRKSDSTESHRTVRGARNSRPVSWAESFTSAYTVVPNQGNSSSSPRSRPRSALIADSDFSMIELEEEDSEGDANEPDDADNAFILDRVPPVPPKAATSAPLAFASVSDHDAGVTALDPLSPTAHSTHTSESLPLFPSSSLAGTGKGPLDLVSSRLIASQHPIHPTPSVANANSNSNCSANVHAGPSGSYSMSGGFGINAINQIEHQTSKSKMGTNTGAPTSASSSMAGPSSTSSSSSSLHVVSSSAVHLHNERVLPSLPSSSGSVSSSGPSSYPHYHSFSHSYSSGPGSVQQSRTSGSNNSQNNPRTPLQPVRQQLSMPNPPPHSSTSSANVGSLGQERQYEYQYPLQLSSQSAHSHTQRHPQQQPRAQTVSLSTPSPSSSSGMGSTMQSAAAGLAKRAVEKMGIGRKWAMGLAGGHGGESDRERVGTGNWSTSSTSASDTRGGGGSGTSGYSSSSSGSMFESGRSGSIDGGAGRRPHSNSMSHPISHPIPTGEGGTIVPPKFLQNTTSKIINVHASRSKGRHTGGTAGSVSSVSSDSHSSDIYHHGYGSSSSLSPSPSPSPSPSSFGIQQVDGPHLGVKLRAGVSNVSNMGVRPRGAMSGGGVVFKKALSACVRDTGIWVGVSSLAGDGGGLKQKEGVRTGEDASEGGSQEVGAKGRNEPTDQSRKGKGELVADLETRKLPALVVRCAQHLLLWGIHEEGLFRVSGMPQHVARLRAEFDSGADYDMTKCTLGDLDPHAVASVFKAYLRELPEPILTQKLQPYFDAVVNKETSINSAAAGGAVEPPTPTHIQSLTSVHHTHHQPGLPSGPKSGFNFIGPPQPATSSSSPRGAALSLPIRKAPSLSTLAMPSFSGIPPPSPALIASIRMLVAQLPEENRDLVRTVVDLIKATARESKETKMPLSNLMLVFCPSLNMTPPLLKVLCEAEGIWGDVEEEEDEDEDEDDVHNIRRRTVVPNVPMATPGYMHAEDVPPPLPAKDAVDDKDHLDEDVNSTADTEEEGSILSGRASLDTNMTDNNLSSDYHASAEGEDEEDGSSMFDGQEGEEMANDVSDKMRRPHLAREPAQPSVRDSEVPTVYLDSRSHCSTASSLSSLVGSDALQEGEDVEEAIEESGIGVQKPGEGETTPGVNSFFQHQSLREPGMDDTLSVSSGGYSMNNMPISSPPPLSSSAESVATPTSSASPSFTQLTSSLANENQLAKEDEHSSVLHPHIVEMNHLELNPQQNCREMTSGPQGGLAAPPTSGQPQPVHFPTSPPSPYHQFPYPEPNVPTSTKTKRRSIPILSLPNFSPSIAPLLPTMSRTPPMLTPNGSPQSVGFPFGEQEREKTLRSKKPSLKLLFSKRSASSLTSMRDNKGMSFISNPILQTQGQGQSQVQRPITPLSAASAMYNYRNSPKSASDSSVSTPSSAVTAPQSSLRSVSTSGLPPVLDTPIEAPSLGLDYGLDTSPPNTAMLAAKHNTEGGQDERMNLATKSMEMSERDLPQTVQKRTVVGRSLQQRSTINQEQSSKSSPRELRPQASTSNLSIVSTTSSYHLSLFEGDDDGNVEDWTQSVLLAADSNWSLQNNSDRS